MNSLSNAAPLPGKSVPKLVTPTSSSGGYKNTKGSFLKHGSNTLRRLSSLTSATPKAGGGGANGFVFHKKPGAVGVEPVDGKTKAQVRKYGQLVKCVYAFPCIAHKEGQKIAL